MFLTGYLSSTGSYFVSLPLSGGAFWAFLRPTSEIFAISHWAPEVVVPSTQWNRGTLSPFCSYFNSPNSCILGGWPLCLERACIGTAIAPRGFTLMHYTTLALKLLFLAMLESGALLSINLEEALY